MKETKKENRVKNREGKQPLSWFSGLLFSEDVYKRIGGYLCCGLLIFLLSWAIAYFFMGEGVLKNTLLVDKVFGIKGSSNIGAWWKTRLGENFKIFKWEFKTEDLFNTWGNILLVTVKNFLHHAVIALIFIFFLNRFKIGQFPLGLFYYLLYTILTGIVVGTNSYSYPPQGFTVLGALVTFLRFGLWVWFSYGLLIASSANWTWLKTSSFRDNSWQKSGRFWSWPVLHADEKEVLVFGLLFLLVSSFAEARLIVFYGQHLF
ncbi:MAG TPA: hypothetical protein DDZ91_06590 [Firmicutes bacterium]|nr:hypothetical protein [Bacillota bacterium]